MLDFPASPTVGQQFTAAGVTWVWDGTKWAASSLTGGPFLPLGGGILTGPVTFPFGSINAPRIDAASGNSRLLLGTTNASLRWGMVLGDNASEFGSNAGSNFAIAGYSDSGALLGNDLTINRATGVVTIPSLAAPQAIGDNRIINGDMRIDQRNNGASGTAVNVYTVDRWQYAGSQASKATWGRNLNAVASAVGFPNYLGLQGISYTLLAGDYFYVSQAIEADMISDFAWGTAQAQPVTLSFWAYSNATGLFSGAISNNGATRSYPFTFSIPVVNTWTRISITIQGDTGGAWALSGNGAGLVLYFNLGGGATFRGPAGVWASANYNGATGAVSIVSPSPAWLYLTGVKLEIGSVATPYNRQSLAKSLADCQRYYEVLSGNVYAVGPTSATGYCFWPFKVTKRATPTVNLTYDNTGVALQTIGPDGVNAVRSLGNFTISTGTASAEL